MYRAAAALAVIARESGRITFTASMRQIAERSGLGTATAVGADTKTARRALQRLEEEGFIKKRVRHSHRNDEPRKMTEIELVFRGGSSSPTIPYVSRCDSEGDKSPPFIQGKFTLEDLLHSVWEHTGLGFTAFRVWASVRSIGLNRPGIGDCSSL
jgi:transposase